jgi:putative holliday junction resolvase
MRVLAIDFGEKRIGLALSDPLGFTAQGLDTLYREDDNSVFVHLDKLCREKEVSKCLVGLPLQMNGEVGSKAKEVLQWIEKLKGVLSCEIQTIDERLSSREVERLMIHQGLSRKKRKTKSDQLSAIILLQNYLERNRYK